MSKTPKEIWCSSGLYYDYVTDWSEGSWCRNNDGGVKYVRADRIEELELAVRYEADLAQMALDARKELEAANKRLNEQMDAIEEMGTESLNALPDCLMRLAPALVENDELKAKLEKAMQVVEMIASADVDAVLGEAVDISCEIIGELMEEEEDE